MDQESYTFKLQLSNLLDEIDRGEKKHGPFHSLHEGYAVILEELDELWDEVKKQKWSRPTMTHEAIQVAASALRLAVQIQENEGWIPFNKR